VNVVYNGFYKGQYLLKRKEINIILLLLRDNDFALNTGNDVKIEECAV
jgi:hypothetical protein